MQALGIQLRHLSKMELFGVTFYLTIWAVALKFYLPHLKL